MRVDSVSFCLFLVVSFVLSKELVRAYIHSGFFYNGVGRFKR